MFGMEGLGPAEWLLVGACFCISVWNTAVGPSGLIAFAAMAAILPPAAVIPVHGATWTAANVARSWFLRRFVNWDFVLPFIIGGLAGFMIGLPLLNSQLLAPDRLRIVLGSFILVATWVPLATLALKSRFGAGAGGLVTATLTLFVGATTALVAALVGQRQVDHRHIMGTTAVCMLYQHGCKTVLFAVAGFSFGDYLLLLVLLIAATIAGAWTGKRLLMSVPQAVFKPVFKAVLTILALDLIRQGVMS